MAVAVLIPTFNEADQITDCIESVKSLAPEWTIVVADGGSSDDTLKLVQASGVEQIVKCQAGRGQQLAAAAQSVPEHDLLFLHADCRLPSNAKDLIEATLAEEKFSGGCFQIENNPTANAGPLVKLFLKTANWRSRRSRFPYGDQAIFCTRKNYEKCGGMPKQGLMEDLEFAKRLNRLAPIQTLSAAIQVSGRRFCERPWRTFLCWHSFPWLYRMGVSPKRLHRWYSK